MSIFSDVVVIPVFFSEFETLAVQRALVEVVHGSHVQLMSI